MPAAHPRSRCVYVAGAFSSPVEARVRWNIAKALFWGLVLVLIYRRRVIVPHVAVQPESTWDEAMAECRFLLLACDEVFLIPGWRKSPGACREFGWAQTLRTPSLSLARLVTHEKVWP